MNLFTLSLAILGIITVTATSKPATACEPISPVIHFDSGEGIRIMSVEDYVTGVVLNEMPHTFSLEALRAQAVAARTYMYYCLENNSHPHKNPKVDVCAAKEHCCGYTTEAELAKRFGDVYARAAYVAAKAAAYSTVGEVITYGGEEILAVWHSSSAEKTENSGDIFMTQLPYLTSVSTPENLDEEIVSFKLMEIKNKIKARYYSYNGDTDIVFKRNSSGRCESLKIGNITLSGAEARNIFSLKSTAFEPFILGDRLFFKVGGYGHGVGLSQYGAQAMALDGKNYEAILTHYYRGAVLSK